MIRIVCLLAAATAPAAQPAPTDPIVWESARFRLVLGPDATWRSLTDKQAKVERCFAPGKVAMAAVTVAPSLPPPPTGAHTSVHDHQKALALAPPRQCNANSASYVPVKPAGNAAAAGGELVLRFAGCDTAATYAVAVSDDCIQFTLKKIEGTRPTEMTLLRLATTLRARVGTRLGLGWDESAGVGILAANRQVRGRAIPHKDHAELLATTQDAPGPRLEGASAALYAAPEKELDALLERLSRGFDLPRNASARTPSRLLPLARRSYWFLHVPQKDAGRVVELCRRSGIRQVMMISHSWCSSVGHYTFNKTFYPDELEGLKATVRKLHDAGILVGMHCFASKISKIDAYVTPVPDKRFWVDRTATLADDAGPADTSIHMNDDLREWPGSPVARQKLWEGGVAKHREVILDDEIIAYESIGPEGKWDTFLGCKRGAWKTAPAAHKAGTVGRHYGVDGCINGYIVDQETSLLDETTSRLAGIFNACDFDMVYFDGGEDVDRRRFDHYVTNFQAVAMSKFQRRPLVHMGTIMTHGLWHSFTRSGTVDTYLNTLRGHIQAGGTIETWPTVRDHIDRSVRYMQSIGDDRMVGELGWFGIWPKGKDTDGLQLDEIEYLMCKSLAHDAPISLQTSFAQMDRHPLTGGVLEIVRAYEELRASRSVGAATRKKLAGPKKDSLLYVAKPGSAPELLAAEPADVAGGRDVRAMLAQRGNDVVASVWHYTGQPGRFEFGLAKGKPRATDLAGQPVGLASEEVGGYLLALPPRRTNILLPNITLDQAR
ncbi:MAG TPA: hypothetical protein PKG77_24195, partial [Phycisphaerae bacterium]|nr:hypothetical protein [Phycisphaerae bacterium]